MCPEKWAQNPGGGTSLLLAIGGTTATIPGEFRNIDRIILLWRKGHPVRGDLGWRIYPGDGSDAIHHGDIRFNPGAPENQPILKKIFVDMFLEFAGGIRNNSNQGITNTLEGAYNPFSGSITQTLTLLIMKMLRQG